MDEYKKLIEVAEIKVRLIIYMITENVKKITLGKHDFVYFVEHNKINKNN